MRRRRKRPPVTWLPNRGSIWSDAASDRPDVGAQNTYAIFASNQVNVTPGDVGAATFIFEQPLVLDNPEQELKGTTLSIYQELQLGDEVQYSYRLRRIVGNMPVIVGVSSGQGLTPSQVIVTCGLIIRKVDPEAPDTAAMRGAQGTAIDPTCLETITDPWIWRRSWLLNPRLADPQGASAPGADDNIDFTNISGNESNMFFTGVNNTMSVDQKTARNVGPDERLFWNMGVRAVGITPGGANSYEIAIMALFDYRVLGTLRMNRGNRKNATR